MANNLRWVPLSPEMDALEAEIGGDQSFVSGRDSQGATVVADADADACAASCTGTHALDNRLFV
jgi:hypothetical protein